MSATQESWSFRIERMAKGWRVVASVLIGTRILREYVGKPDPGGFGRNACLSAVMKEQLNCVMDGKKYRPSFKVARVLHHSQVEWRADWNKAMGKKEVESVAEKGGE